MVTSFHIPIRHIHGVGWADDTAIEIPVAGIEVILKGMEVYSGDLNGNGFEPDYPPGSELLSAPS